MEEHLRTIVEQEARQEEAIPTEEAEYDKIHLTWQKIATGEDVTTTDHDPVLGLESLNSWGTVDICRVNQWLNQCVNP